MKKLLLTINILLIMVNTAFLVYNIINGNAGPSALGGVAISTCFMAILSLATS